MIRCVGGVGAILMTLTMSLPPGTAPETARALARRALAAAGCASVIVEMDRASARDPLLVRAWCAELNGSPASVEPERPRP